MAGVVSISTPTSLSVSGSTGSFLVSGLASIASVKSSIRANAQGDFMLNSGGDMSIINNNGAVVKTIYGNIELLAPSGIVALNGSNVALRGLDGAKIDTDTKLTIAAKSSLTFFSDQLAMSGKSSFDLKTTDPAATISMVSTGSFSATSKSLGITGPTVTVTAPSSIAFVGTGSLHLAVSNPITITTTNLVLSGGPSTTIAGNAGAGVSAVCQLPYRDGAFTTTAAGVSVGCADRLTITTGDLRSCREPMLNSA
jgi:hypothetical protein